MKEKHMFKMLSSLVMIGAGLAWLAAGVAAQEKADKADTQAKEAAEQFMKAMTAEDVERVIKAVELPFFWDGVQIVKDRDDLKKRFAKVFEEKDLIGIEYNIKEVHTLAKYQEKLSAKDRDLLTEVLGNADRVVVVAVKREGIAVMVRIREGKAKVAGFRD
jgi:hypothetical protein